MAGFSTPAIVLRRVDFGDYDLILSLFTATEGKLSAMAKAAKRSQKRFGGVLELFSVLDVVFAPGRAKGLPLLQEAELRQAFPRIRADIKKTAYASYWLELVNLWLEEGDRQPALYTLLVYVLRGLDGGDLPPEALSILFQMKFLSIAGLCPNLSHCCTCRDDVEAIPGKALALDYAQGGLVCEDCLPYEAGHRHLARGTVKQLQWIERSELPQAARIRFSPQALREGLELLEKFVPYHLGKEPRSLKFLREMRR